MLYLLCVVYKLFGETNQLIISHCFTYKFLERHRRRHCGNLIFLLFNDTKIKRCFSQINFLIFRLVGGAPLSQATSGSDSKRPKTMLCVKFVANGTCRYGVNCTFAHSVKEVKMALEMQAKQDTNGNPSENTKEIYINDVTQVGESNFLHFAQVCK